MGSRSSYVSSRSKVSSGKLNKSTSDIRESVGVSRTGEF